MIVGCLYVCKMIMNENNKQYAVHKLHHLKYIVHFDLIWLGSNAAAACVCEIGDVNVRTRSLACAFKTYNCLCACVRMHLYLFGNKLVHSNLVKRIKLKWSQVDHPK